MKNALVLTAFLLSISLHAQKIATWKGGAPGHATEWNYPANWEENRVPNEFSQVIIPDVSSSTFSNPVLDGETVEIWSLQFFFRRIAAHRKIGPVDRHRARQPGIHGHGRRRGAVGKHREQPGFCQPVKVACPLLALGAFNGASRPAEAVPSAFSDTLRLAIGSSRPASESFLIAKTVQSAFSNTSRPASESFMIAKTV